MKDKQLSRRGFLAGAAALAAASGVTGRMATVLAQQQAPAAISTASPNEKLNVAAIGAGGKGGSDINGCKSENVVALCDVDWHRAAETFAQFPNAKQYKDYRKMLEEMKEIDAVTVSTPDHMHAPAALMAMSLGKHVYVQKPLTHSSEEARMLRLAAKKYNVATQMGNQGHSEEGCRRVAEAVWHGDIGQVREAHIWTNRPVWPQGEEFSQPLPEQPIPDFIDWDLWLGVAPKRPFGGYRERDKENPSVQPVGYAPFAWRGWWDFGCGALGDMACHIMDAANFALGLGHPVSVEVVSQNGNNDQTAPESAVLRYEFPARTVKYADWGVNIEMPAVTVYWHDGGMKPSEPMGVPKGTRMGDGDNGSMLIGDKGIITAGEYGGDPRMLPDARMQDYKFPDPVIPRIEFPGSDVEAHYMDWLTACKGGRPACSNFDYSGPFTEVVVLGNLALLTGHKMEWDGEGLKVTNIPEANKYVRKTYPDGWGMNEMRKELGIAPL
ncbi:MAG: Gfo/Idh/MocA family oxidoreductase [FCB group bacterium]|jgi:predicted dehydrogenase|nr:Gfo/Idh/MocA family oxidoreductase [FCB group bacterium]